MKTLDEAMDIVIVKAESDEELDRKASKVQDDASRYKSIADEIMDNEKAALLVIAMRRAMPNLERALLSMFVNGVIVGIEMEKQELRKSWRDRLPRWMR